MARITQHLWFEKDMEAALNCYVALIPGSSVNWFSDLPADTPSGPAGSVKLAAFTLGTSATRRSKPGHWIRSITVSP